MREQFKKDELKTFKYPQPFWRIGQHAQGPKVLGSPPWGRITGWSDWAVSAVWAGNKSLSSSLQVCNKVHCLQAEVEQTHTLGVRAINHWNKSTGGVRDFFFFFHCWQLFEKVSFEKRLKSALIKMINLERVCSTCFAGCQTRWLTKRLDIGWWWILPGICLKSVYVKCWWIFV